MSHDELRQQPVSDQQHVAYLEARVGELHQVIGGLRADLVVERDGASAELKRVEASRRDWATEAEYRRREVEFEANGERWANAIVGRDGHRRINGFHECECGEPCPSLRMWSDHLAKTRAAEGTSLCACLSGEQQAQLQASNAAHPDGPQWSPPQCAVHPEVGVALDPATWQPYPNGEAR